MSKHSSIQDCHFGLASTLLQKPARQKVLSIVLLLLTPLFVAPILGQRPLNFNQGFAQRAGNQPSTAADEGPDSTVYKFYFLDSPEQTEDITDSLTDIRFLHAYSLSPEPGEYLNTGNYGSAMMPLLYQPDVYTRFTAGYNQYRPYQIRPETFRFYNQNRPLSNLYFSQFGTQENIMAAAAFSRNFSDGLSLSLNYLRVSQKGLYARQNTRSTAFGMGLHYENKEKTYRLMVLFTNNAHEETHNGGVLPTANLDDPFKEALPVLLGDAATRQQERHVSVTQYLTPKKKDGTATGLYYSLHTAYQPSYYKFTDTQLDSLDIQFYGKLITDPRGLRRYVQVDNIHNGAFIHGQVRANVRGRLGVQADVFRVQPGKVSDDFWRTDVTATFDGTIAIRKSVLIDTRARLGIGSNAGNADVTGRLTLRAGNIGTLQGSARFFRTEQAYRAERLDLNDEAILAQTLAKSAGTTLSGLLSIPVLRTTVGIEQTLVQNPVYWAVTGIPVQADDVFSLTRFTVSVRANSPHLGVENKGFVQLQSQALYPLPKWCTSHQLYYKGNWFSNVMEVTTGIDGRILGPYTLPGYQPLFGNFHLTETEAPVTPVIDVFFMARVSSFRAKFIFENAGQFLFPNTRYTVATHPLNPPTLRFGIQWLLKD